MNGWLTGSCESIVDFDMMKTILATYIMSTQKNDYSEKWDQDEKENSKKIKSK